MIVAEHLPVSIFFCFTGSSSNPDEDQLLRHLFHSDHDLTTSPIIPHNHSNDVAVIIGIRKIVALVRSFLDVGVSFANR